MLPDFRFIIGATLATALLAMAGLGLFTATRLAHHAKVGPLEASRSLAYSDPFETRFTDLETARRFDALARRAGAADASMDRDLAPTAPPAGATPDDAALKPDNAVAQTAAATPVVQPEQPEAAVAAPAESPPVLAYEPDHHEHEQSTAAAAAITGAPTELAAPATIPAEMAVAAAPATTEAAVTDRAALAAPAPSDEQIITGSVRIESESAPAAAERLAAVQPAPAAIEAPAAAPAAVKPAATAAPVAPAALPNAAVTVHPARKAAPVTRAVAPVAVTRTIAPAAARPRVRSEPQHYQQPQHAYPQRLTGFEWAGYYGKPHAVEQPQGYAPQAYAPQPYQQYRTQPYREPQYARDPYTNQQWRPWSELGR